MIVGYVQCMTEKRKIPYTIGYKIPICITWVFFASLSQQWIFLILHVGSRLFLDEKNVQSYSGKQTNLSRLIKKKKSLFSKLLGDF